MGERVSLSIYRERNVKTFRVIDTTICYVDDKGNFVGKGSSDSEIQGVINSNGITLMRESLTNGEFKPSIHFLKAKENYNGIRTFSGKETIGAVVRVLDPNLEDKKKASNNLNIYVKKIYECDPYLAEQLIEGPGFKEASLKVLKEMGLPRFNTEIVDVVEYLNDPKKVLSKLRYDRYFANIIDKTSPKRTKRIGLNVEGINNFLNEVVEPSKRSNFQILLSECPDQPYNGVLIVDSNKRYFLEMIQDELPRMVTGNRVPDYRAYFDRDNLFTLSTKYAGTNRESLKLKMYELIQLTEFRKGYYEFCLAYIDGELKPFFFEYSDKETYSLRSIYTRKDYSKKSLVTSSA